MTQLHGLDSVLKNLEGVKAEIAKKAIRTACRKGMAIVQKDVRAHAPVDSSDDADTIRVKRNIAMRSRMKYGTLYVRVGVRGGAKVNPDTPYYWRFVEFGTERQPARPFMRPALQRNADAVFSTIVAELKRALAKAV